MKPKKVASLQQSLSEKDLGPYGGGRYVSPTGQTVALKEVAFSQLREGANRETVVLGKVVGVITATDTIAGQYVWLLSV